MALTNIIVSNKTKLLNFLTFGLFDQILIKIPIMLSYMAFAHDI